MSGKITEEVYTRETQEMANRIGMCRMHEVANLLARSYPLCPIEDSQQPQRRSASPDNCLSIDGAAILSCYVASGFF